MKFTTNFLLLMASCSASLAFQPSITGRLSISSSLPMAKHDKFNSNDVALFWGPIATAVAGWTLASQVAMASTMMVDSSSTTLLQQGRFP